MGETPGSVVTLLCSGMHFFNAEKRIADCVLEDTAGVAAMTSPNWHIAAPPRKPL